MSTSTPATDACHCGRTVARTVAPTVEVEVDAAGLRLDGVGLYRCVAGHTMIADHNLAQRILTAIDDHLLTSKSRLLRRNDTCGDCEAALTLPGRRTEVPVPFPSPFGVVTPTMVTTMVRCPECGRDQLPRNVADLLPRLVSAAIDQISGG